MKTRYRLIHVVLPLAALAIAPSGTCWEGEKPCFVHNVPPVDGALSWEGKPERTYFVQHSGDLQAWLYQAEIWTGDGTPEAATFECSDPRLFARLRFTDIPTTDPDLADFDNDGASNWTELDSLGTDPLDADTDNDGVLDGTDTDPLDSGDGDALYAVDSDGDGLIDSEELARGTSPTLYDTDGDGHPDASDAYPLDPSRWQLTPFDSQDTTGPTITLELPANAIPL
jgi:hypothetical protein